MRHELIQRIAKDIAMEQRLKPNALFPKNFYTLDDNEKKEVLRLYKKYAASSSQQPWTETK